MPRDVRACLADVVDACDAYAVSDIDLDGYRRSRLVRSAVEQDLAGLRSEAASLLRKIDEASMDSGDYERLCIPNPNW